MAPSWTNFVNFTEPQVESACLKFTKDKREYKIGLFARAYSVSGSFSTNVLPTLTGWHLVSHGKNPEYVTIQGVLIDTATDADRLNFLAQYQNLMRSAANDLQEYMHCYTQELFVYGHRFRGAVNSFHFSKSTNSLYTYDFSMEFISLESEVVGDFVKIPNGLSGSITGLVSIKPEDYEPEEGSEEPETFALEDQSLIYSELGKSVLDVSTGGGSSSGSSSSGSGGNSTTTKTLRLRVIAGFQKVRPAMSFAQGPQQSATYKAYLGMSPSKEKIISLSSNEVVGQINLFAPVYPISSEIRTKKDPASETVIKNWVVPIGSNNSFETSYPLDSKGNPPNSYNNRKSVEIISGAISYISPQNGTIKTLTLPGSERFYIAKRYVEKVTTS